MYQRSSMNWKTGMLTNAKPIPRHREVHLTTLG